MSATAVRSDRFWLGTSWKMNKTLPEARAFCDVVSRAPVVRDAALQPFVIPPFTAARQVKEWFSDSPVLVGAQNMHWADEGAWTGEISPPMLRDCDLDLVELGHSERRAHFGETDETVGLKAAAALRHGLLPLICIGESADDKRTGKADAVLAREVRGALRNVGDLPGAILLAYEPVWAIGVDGTPASADYAQARHEHILSVARETCPDRSIACLYGGSVNLGNCAELAACPGIDGLFIGRSAWSPQGFLDIVDKVAG